MDLLIVMKRFESVSWTVTAEAEPFVTDNGQTVTTGIYRVSESMIPFTLSEWATEIQWPLDVSTVPDNIYAHCASRLTRPSSKRHIAMLDTRLYLDPGYVDMASKMASYYILKLLSTLPRKQAWKLWDKVPVTTALLKDRDFCLCVVALHPVLYGRVHPVGRNHRSVFLEALALWDLPKYSIVQFVHPDALKTFRGTSVSTAMIEYADQNTSPRYWVFNDVSVVTRALGRPGARRWFELEFAGPAVVQHVTRERKRHQNDMRPLNPFLQKNRYTPAGVGIQSI
tara:strand:+ start:916 stop:1764 length:849 start_codon:yes stop_codon:yes gene_type:complete